LVRSSVDNIDGRITLDLLGQGREPIAAGSIPASMNPIFQSFLAFAMARFRDRPAMIFIQDQIHWRPC